MDKSKIPEINQQMKLKIGYEPYVINDRNKIACVSCWHEYQNPDEASLTKTNVIKTSDNLPIEVHQCPACRYMKGVNVNLKKRFTDIRKEMGLFEFPGNSKFTNKYCTPVAKYNFSDPVTETTISVTEAEFYELYKDFKKSKTVNQPPPAEVVVTREEPVVEKKEEKPFFNDTSTESQTELTGIDANKVYVETVTGADLETVDEGLAETNDFSEVRDEVDEDETMNENTGDDEDLSDLFGNGDESEVNSEEFSTPVVENGTTDTDTIIDDDITDAHDEDEFSDELIDEFFSSDTDESKKGNQHKNDSKNSSFNTGTTGAADFKIKSDPGIDSMIRENLEDRESDVFRIDERKEHVFNIVRNSRVADLVDAFNDSNAKLIIDRILTLFEKRGRKIKHKIYISEVTHELPVVDFEGNIRLIFVNLDVDGGKYNIQNEINSKLQPTFGNTSEYEMMTFVVLSDMTKTQKMNRVVLAVSKNIAFNLKIRGIFNPISIIKDSERYFYTTDEFDSEKISNFESENSAGNSDKPCTNKIAIVSHWSNPNTDDVWKYRKDLSNRAVLSRGGNIDYNDLSMFMTCCIKYIVLPQKPDGTINVTIVDYIESLNLYIRDGLGTLIGVLVHNIKSNNPNAKIDLYYEIDPTTIPSPCISRYMKSNFVRPIEVNQDVNQFNTIIEKVSSYHGIQPNKIPVEGEPFDSPEYQANYWKTFVLRPENRRFINDDQRIDWRYFGRKSFAKTLGERFKDYKNIDLNDRRARQSVLERVGYETVIQPPVIKAIVVKDFCRNALIKVMETCSGLFSISQYIAANRSMVVDDNYMMNNMGAQQYGYGQMPNMNPYQQFQQPQFFNGGFQQTNPMFESVDSLIARSRANQNK